MKLSVVTTLYKSSPYIQEFYERTRAAAKKFAGDSYEIIFVNDGSPDDSLNVAVALSEKDDKVVVVDLSRNFGHHKAIMTGLMHSAGEYVFLIDSDLEEEPEWLLVFAEQIKNSNADVVYGRQENRKGRAFEKWSGKLFWHIINSASTIHIPADITTARLMTKTYVKALTMHTEREVFLGGLFAIVGFAQHPYLVTKSAHSETTYTLTKKVALFINAIVSFSNMPLVLIFYTGLAIFLLSFIYMSYLVAMKILYTVPVDGWTSLIASIWLIGGLIILFLGIIGIYLAKIFSEVKQRPYTIIKNIYKQDNAP